MNSCPFCNGRIEETDKYGTIEECLHCGTTYKLLPMGNNDEQSE